MKKNLIVWTEEALNDLDEIHDFLALKSEAAADKIIFKLLDRVKQLEYFPESGPKQEGLKKNRYRFLVESNYKIIYWADKTGVLLIASVFDTRQDPEKINSVD